MGSDKEYLNMDMLAKEWEYFDAFMEQCQTLLIHEMFFMSQEEFRELAGNSCVGSKGRNPASNFDTRFRWDECGLIGVCFGVFSNVVRIRTSNGSTTMPFGVNESGTRYLVPRWIPDLRMALEMRAPLLPGILQERRIRSWWQ